MSSFTEAHKDLAARVFLVALGIAVIATGAFDFFVRYELLHRVSSSSEMQPPSAQSESEWAALTSDEMRELTDKLSGISGVTSVTIYYVDPKDEDLAVSLAQAMHLAGWPDAALWPIGQITLGMKISVGPDLASVGHVLRTLLKNKFGDEPALGDASKGTVFVTIGRRPPK